MGTNEEEIKTSEPTVVNVEMPKEDSSDLNNEEIIESHKDKTLDTETIKQEQKDYMLKLAKESNIDWNTIEFEEDGVTPKVTSENCNIFNAVVSEYFDTASMDTYIGMARDAIDDYKNMKKLVDSGEADNDDLEYFKSCSIGYEDSRLVLAMIQQESKKLEKEFSESKVAEKYIKAVTLKTLHDYIINEYKLTDSWFNPENKPIEELDKTKEIENDLMKFMYITPLFKQQIKRYFVKSMSCPAFNIFSHSFINRSEDRFVLALQKYISYIETKENLDVSVLIKRDFQIFDFFTTVIRYALYNAKDPSIETVDEKELSILSEKLDPEKIITSKSDNIYVKISNVINKIVDSLMNIANVERITHIAKTIFTEDHLFSKVIPNASNIDDYKNIIIKISESFPEVQSANLGKWGDHYVFMNKYENYYTYKSLCDIIADDSKTEIEKRKACINTIISIVHAMYMFTFSETILNLSEFIKYELNAKDTRTTMFATVINNLMLQHNFGYKASFTSENCKDDKLYDLAKDFFKDQYEMFIGDKTDDILLKEVDLSNVRESYADVVNDMLELLNNNIISIFNDDYIIWYNKELTKQAEIAHNSKNKHKKHRR